MSQDKLSKRESIKNALIAATGLGLSMATMNIANAQPAPTAAPAATSSPGPTTPPKYVTTVPSPNVQSPAQTKASAATPAKRADK